VPFPSDEKITALGEDLLKAIDGIFGVHPGFRAVHAKGILLSGTFTPTSAAGELSRAPHFTRPSTPVFGRFSNNTGIPLLPDNDPNANPRGCAVRFQLAEHVHTDIISHSANGFPSKDGKDFLDFLKALAASAGSTESPSPVEKYLGAHPAALAFVQLPKPPPSSFAREMYFGLMAYRFTNQAGASRFGRYRLVPAAGVEHIDAATADARGANYLQEELQQRLAAGPIRFDVIVQLPKEGDAVHDVTVQWPEDRPTVNIGKLVFDAVVPDNAHEQKMVIFDPVPRVDGIEPSDDPLIEVRAAAYLISGRRRRQAPET
jgi:catalase